MTKEYDNSFGIAAVVLGILSIVFSVGVLLGSVGGTILGIVALVFALIQKKKANNKWAYIGMILAIIGIVLNIALLIITVNAIRQIAAQMQLAAEQMQAQGALQIPTQ